MYLNSCVTYEYEPYLVLSLGEQIM